MARNITDEWFTLNIHSCNRCNLKTSDTAVFQSHHCKPRQQITAGVSYSLASATFTCSLCTVQLSETEFREHLEGHLSLKPYGCKYCGEDFASRSDVYQHLLSFHAQEEQIFVLRLSGRTKEIMQKAKNNGKEFYKPVNVLPSKNNSGEVAISKTLSQNLSTMPRPPQKQTASVASYSLPSGLSSSSSVRNTVPTVSPPVALETFSHAVTQSNSNTSLASARLQQLPAGPGGQKRYVFVLTSTQPQIVPVAAPSASVLQTQAPSCLSQNVSTATTQAYRLPQKHPSQLILPYVPNNLPVLLPAQRMTRGIHLVTNVSPPSVNQLRNPSALTAPPIFNLNQAVRSPLSVQNTTGLQMTSAVLSSIVHNASSNVAPNVPIARRDPTPTVSPTLVNPPLAPSITASSEDSLRNTPVMSVGVSASCQNSTESDADNIYKVSIQPFHKDIKSNVNDDFAESGSQQINQNASSSVTQFEHDLSTDAVVKNEDSTYGDSDCAMQIRIESIMSLSVCPEEFQQCVQTNVTDTVTDTESSVADARSNMTNTESSVTDAGCNMTNAESSVTDAGSNTTEQQVDTLECKNFSFLHVVKGYCLCLVCHLKWCADSDTFFKHIWEKHTHGEDFSCCPTGYSPYCPRLNTVIKIIYDKSQVQMSDHVKSYFTPKSSIETENEDVHNISSETISSALSSSVEAVQQINMNEGSSATVSGRPSSARGECEQTLPAESVLCTNESSASPPPTLIPNHHTQNCDSNALAASDRCAQDMQEPIIQIGEQPEKENSCSTYTSELTYDPNFGGEILLNIAAIDLSTAAASNSGHDKSNSNTNTYDDISDDDYGIAINDHHRDTGNVNDSVLESLYSEELPLDLSKKTAQAEKSYNVVTTPVLATETVDVGYYERGILQTERLLLENIRKSPDDLTTATSSLETETTLGNPRTRAERVSTESIAMGDDDDVSLRCFYWCGSCSFSCPKAVEFEVHVQEAHGTLDGFPCYYCGFRCLSGKHLIQHMEDHIRSDNKKTFSCSMLENSDTVVTQVENNDMKFIIRMLKTSLAGNSDSDAVFHFACNKCQSEFSDLNKLAAHLQESLLKVIECKHCDSLFLNSFSWQKHMTVEHVDLPRMYCIKQKLLCCERKKHNNVPLQTFPEDIICLSDTEREVETTVEENICHGTHLESQTISVTACALTKMETVSSHVIENSNMCNQTVASAEIHSNLEKNVSVVTDGVQVQDNELMSVIPRLLDLVKTSPVIKSALMSAVSLNTGRTSDEQGAAADTDPNSSESSWTSAAHELCMSSTDTTTISERGGSIDVDLHAFMRPASNNGNNELREVTVVRGVIGSNDGLLPIENIGNKEEFVQTLLETCTSSDTFENVNSAMSHDENSHTNMLLSDKDPCSQEGVIEIPTRVQLSSHNFAESESENTSALPFIVTGQLNDHSLNENSESYFGQAEAVCGISLPIDRLCSSNFGNSVDNKVGSNTGASSDLDPATVVESQDGDVTSGKSCEKVSCILTRINDCSSGSKDYAISKPSSLPDTEVSDIASIPTANLQLAETRIILDVSEQSKREYTENTCLPVQDVGTDNTDSRQESGRSSAVLENIESEVQQGIDIRVPIVDKNNEDQVVSVAVNEKDTSQPVFLPSYHKVARPEDSFASAPSISEDPLSLPLETMQKSSEHAVFQQISKDVVMTDQDFEGAHNSQMGMNGHFTPTTNNALKTVSHDSGAIPQLVTLDPDYDSQQIDFNSSKGLECTLQESASGFFGNNVTLDNTSCGHNLLHPNLNEMSSDKIDRQVEKRSGTYEVVHYNNNSLASTEHDALDISNETSRLENAESREIPEENVLNLSSHSDNFLTENNNTVSGGQILIASNVTESGTDVSNEEDLRNSSFRCECGSVIFSFTDSDDNHNVQPEKSLKTPITGKCVKCILLIDKHRHLDDTTEHVDSETRDLPTSKDSMSLSKQAIENCVKALKRKVPFNLEYSSKISRLENNSDDFRSPDPPESSNKSPEKSKTNPSLNPGLETATDIDSMLLPDSSDATDIESMLLPDSSDVAHGLTSPRREILDSPCKRKSEAEQSEGIKSSKLLRIDSEKHRRPEKTSKKLVGSVARSQSLNGDQGTEVNVPDSARVRCSVCTSVTSPSYTELSNHIKSQHAHDKSARVCRIPSRSLQNAVVHLQRFEGTAVLVKEVQNDVTMSPVHTGTTAHQNTGINSETNIKTMVRSKSEDKHKKEVKVDNKVKEMGMQHTSEVSNKSLSAVQNSDISVSDSKHHFKCSVCIFLTSHSYTEIKEHIKSQHPDDKSAKVNRINPKCLFSATKYHVGSEDATAPSQKVDLTRLNVKQCFKCSVCICLSSHSFTEMKQHLELQHPHNISAKICRVDPQSSHDVFKKRKSEVYKCIQPKCNFIGKWDFEKMRKHITSKHPYYSCGYCKAPYTILALLHNHFRFVHRGMKPKVTNSTISMDLLFKRVDFSSNGHSADNNDIASDTCAVQKKRHGKPSTTNDTKICEAKARSKLQALETKRRASSQSCDTNATLDQQNQPPEASKPKDTSESLTVAQGLKTQQCKTAHSKSESILEHFFKKVSPMPEHNASSAEKLTVSSKISTSCNNGGLQSAKTERSVMNTTADISVPQLNLAALLQSQASGSRVVSTVTEESSRKSEKSTTDNDTDSTFAKTLAATHRTPPTESPHVKKTVALNTASSVSPQPSKSNTCGNKVSEYKKSDLHSSAPEKVSKDNVKKPLRLLSSQHDVNDKNSTATSVLKNVNLNSATGMKSSSTVKNQSNNSTHIPESGHRRDSVHEKIGVLCSEAASAIVAPKSISKEQGEKQCGAWMAGQLEAQTAAEGDQRKECGPEGLRTPHSESSYIQNGSRTEFMCENAAVPPIVPIKIKSSKIDYPFRCKVCSRKMNCVSDVEKHYASSHPMQDIQMTERSSKFVYSNSGKCLHWKNDREAPTAPYLCNCCAFRNTKRSDVEAHIKSVHPDSDASVFVLRKPISCEASRSHSPTPSNYFCNLCNEVKSSEFHFRLHLAKHPGFKHTTKLTTGASNVCPKCGYVAMNKSDYSTHMNAHMSERRFKCSMCVYEGHHKKVVQNHIKSVHKVVDDDVGIIDRDKPGHVELRPRLVNIDPKVLLVNPFREHPKYLQRLVQKHDIKMLDLPGEICSDILDREHSKYGKYFDINKFM